VRGLFVVLGTVWGRKATLVSIGWLIALLVLLAAFVLFLMGRMDGLTAAMFGGLAIAILLSPFPVGKFPWVRSE
jgi:hypothetical protein